MPFKTPMMASPYKNAKRKLLRSQPHHFPVPLHSYQKVLKLPYPINAVTSHPINVGNVNNAWSNNGNTTSISNNARSNNGSTTNNSNSRSNTNSIKSNSFSQSIGRTPRSHNNSSTANTYFKAPQGQVKSPQSQVKSPQSQVKSFQGQVITPQMASQTNNSKPRQGLVRSRINNVRNNGKVVKPQQQTNKIRPNRYATPATKRT
jgi:hypothetical protein